MARLKAGISDELAEGLQAIERIEWRAEQQTRGDDWVIREEPMEIRIQGASFAVIMRTPGHDEEMVRGFLMTERIVQSSDHVASVRHCSTVDPEQQDAEDNVMLVSLRKGIKLDLARLRRNIFASSSCGICGKATIENAMVEVATPVAPLAISPMKLMALPKSLKQKQLLFQECGGVHAAGLFDRSGELLVVREDVGRHNAVDKVVGWTQSQDGAESMHFPLKDLGLIVSGRISYEIVQKAYSVGIGLVVGVSAPSSLAVGMAEASGMALVGFLREGRMCLYTQQELWSNFK